MKSGGVMGHLSHLSSNGNRSGGPYPATLNRAGKVLLEGRKDVAVGQLGCKLVTS